MLLQIDDSLLKLKALINKFRTNRHTGNMGDECNRASRSLINSHWKVTNREFAGAEAQVTQD